MKNSPFLPVIRPLVFLLHDPRFIIGALSLVPLIVPQLTPYTDLFILIGLVLITGYSVDNALAAAKAVTPPQTLKAGENSIITIALSDLISYLTTNQPSVVLNTASPPPKTTEAVPSDVIQPVTK